MSNEIYLDYHATTPVLPEVLEAMSPYFCNHFGNANSNHQWGWKAEMAFKKSTKQVADLLHCKASQVYFTSGATESIHWAMIGWAKKNPGGKIVTTNVEHKATYGAAQWAESLGCEVVILAVDSYGMISPDDIEKELGEKPTLVSLIHGNNEIGTLNPIHEISKRVHKYENCFIHVDCAQSVGKLEIHFTDLNLDFLSFSGHKLYAPKGIGALVIKDKETISPLFMGGGQQGGMRAGTSNIPSIVGIGTACQWCREHLNQEKQRLEKLRDFMIEKLISTGKVKLNGHPSQRLPYNINVTFSDITMDKLLLKLPKVGFSSSSACNSEQSAPSHVLTALGLTADEASRTLRFGIGHSTTIQELEEVSEKIIESLKEAEAFHS